MQYQIKKTVFLRGVKSEKTTLSLTTSMYDALKFIAEETGDTVPEVICEALEQYLTHLLKNGAIPAPKTDEEHEEKT